MGEYMDEGGNLIPGAEPPGVELNPVFDELVKDWNEFANRGNEALRNHTHIIDDTIGVPDGYIVFELDTAVPVPHYISGTDEDIVLPAGVYATRQFDAHAFRISDDDDFMQIVYDIEQHFEMPEDGLTLEAANEGTTIPKLFNVTVRLVPAAHAQRGAFDIDDLANSLAALEADENMTAERMEELCTSFAAVRGRWYHFSPEEKNMPELPKQDLVALRRQYVPITKAAHSIKEPSLFDAGGALLDVASRQEKRRGLDITTHIAFSYDDEDVQLSRPLDAYDNDVQGGLATLWEAGARTFTVAQLHSGIGHDKRPGKKALAELERRLDNQRRIMAKIDYTQEARGRALELDGEAVKLFKLEGHLAELRKLEIESINGKVVTGYQFLEQPILYQHAKALGQIASYPQRLLKAGRGSDTQANMTVKRAILERVAILKNKKRRQIDNRMRYATLYEMAGIDPTDRDRRNRMNDYVLSVLDDLKSRGEVTGYQEYTEGARKVRAGVEIYV